MTFSEILILTTGGVVLIAGIVTFMGNTFLNRRNIRLFGIELDKTVIGIILFLIGLVLILSVLIVLVGPQLSGGLEKS